TDLANAQKGAEAEKKISRFFGTAGIGLERFFSGIVGDTANQGYQGKVLGFWNGILNAPIGRGWWGRIMGSMNAGEIAGDRASYFDNGYQPVKAARSDKAAPPLDNSNPYFPKAKASVTTEKDPMDALIKQQQEDLALHEQERQQQLLDSQRSLMTIGDRRA